jgi:hypothetical protein
MIVRVRLRLIVDVKMVFGSKLFVCVQDIPNGLGQEKGGGDYYDDGNGVGEEMSATGAP